MGRKRAVCLGGASWDQLVIVDGLPRRGNLVKAQQRAECAGGVARCALALRRLGLDVTVRTPAGNGRYTALLVAELTAAGVRCDTRGTDEDLVSTVLLHEGERTIISSGTVPGTGAPPADWPRAEEDLLLCATSSTEEFILRAGTLDSKALSSYDGGDQACTARVAAAQAADIVTGRPSFFAGIPSKREARPLDGARELLAGKARLVAITDGRHSVRVMTPEDAFDVPVDPVLAVDTTGCGDVFHATLAGCLADGLTPREAATQAVALAREHARVLGNSALR